MGAVFSLRDLVRVVTETLAQGRLGILSEQDGEPSICHVIDMFPTLDAELDILPRGFHAGLCCCLD
jgi:hypothetical protein